MQRSYVGDYILVSVAQKACILSYISFLENQVIFSGNIMARGTCHNREKMSIEWFQFVLLFHTFLQNISLISAIESHSQGKIPNKKCNYIYITEIININVN
jgi:hypothetical protein